MVIIIVDVDSVAIPTPIAAAIKIIGSHDPVRTIVEDNSTRAVIDGGGDEGFFDMLVAAMGIVTPRHDAVVLVVPVAVVVATVLVVTFVAAVVVAAVVVVAVVVAVVIISVAVLVPAIVLAVVVMVFMIAAIVAILSAARHRQGSSQYEYPCGCNQFSHWASTKSAFRTAAVKTAGAKWDRD